MKLLKWLDKNILLTFTLFLLAFIPLYPKLPLFGVHHTWVYIRLDDIFVALALIAWGFEVLRKKAALNTPLTIPMIIFWGIGAISTFYAVVFLFPHLANVFPNVAVLYLLRHVEYLSVFFLAFSSIDSEKRLKYVLAVIVVSLLAVCFYGYGQRGFIVGFAHRFPAFSTMNEEFAKGEPLYISAENRIQSTFAGHYDLAAYLILLIPLMGSMIFGIKKWWLKLLFFATWIAGVVLLLMTASRVSFAVYLVGITFMLILQKQKKFIIPVVFISIAVMMSFQGISSRFAQTITTQEIVVDQKSHKVIGLVTNENGKPTIKQNTVSTGEQLPPSQSGFINIPSQTDDQPKTTTVVQIEKKKLVNGKETTEITNVQGDYVLKKALALDLSFTTRFQGEWPRALDAFSRDILLGSGYSSINAATDNNYLRMLGETGILGFLSFLLIFVIISIYAYKVLPNVTSQYSRSFVYGILAGILGLSLNAILIDVFEASKVAYILWLLIGITLALLHHYQKNKINYYKELIRFITSSPAVFVYLFIIAMMVFGKTFTNYFVADDFTWLRWVADCKKVLYQSGMYACEPTKTIFLKFFTDSQGFFYRPAAKLYFYFLYAIAWLNPYVYHLVSLLIHVAVTAIVFLLSMKILKNRFYAFLTALIFLLLSSHSEAVLWIASSGHLLAAFFTGLGLLFHMYWRETKKYYWIILTVLSILIAPLFQETGIVAAPLIILFDMFVLQKDVLKQIKKQWDYLVYILTIPVYFVMRTYAKSLWLNGDYNYNLQKLPFNVIGNLLGYIGIVLFGSSFLNYYLQLRNLGRQHILPVLFGCLFVIIIGFIFVKFVLPKMKKEERKIIFAGIILFVVPLLPVLGLGNAALRYSYFASFGIILLVVYLLKSLVDLIKNKNISAIVAGVVVVLFALNQINLLYKSNDDWYRAGQVTNNLLLDMNATFPGQNATPPNPVFYFVNVPIKTGEAWIFPVGIDDALWFTFQNANLTVHTTNNLNLALDEAEGSTSARVFEFDKTGGVSEVVRTKETIPVPKK